MASRLIFDRQNYLNFEIAPQEIEAKLGDAFILEDEDDESWAEFWKPLEVVFNDDSDKGTAIHPPQITTWFTNQLVLNQQAYEAIGKQLEKSCEMLPVSCNGVPYWLCHVTARLGLDVVDLKNSERTIDATDFIEATKIAFLEDKINDLVFKTEYNGFQNIYCTDKLQELVESHGLKGLVFSKNMAAAPA